MFMLRTIGAIVLCAAAGAAQDGASRMPLQETRTNLELARAYLLEGDFHAAAAPLRAAARCLADFEAEYPGPEAIHADYLREQMAYRALRLQWDPGDTVSWINYWLDIVDHWQRKAQAHSTYTLEPWQQGDSLALPAGR